MSPPAATTRLAANPGPSRPQAAINAEQRVARELQNADEHRAAPIKASASGYGGVTQTPSSRPRLSSSSRSSATLPESSVIPSTPKVSKRKRRPSPESKVQNGYRHSCFSRDLRTVVTVTVGVEQQIFVLHQAALCDVSPFFTSTFTGGFGEGNKEELELPVTDLLTFEMFVEWLFSRKIMVKQDFKAQPLAAQLVDLTLLYIFADNYDIPQLERDTMDLIIDLCQKDAFVKMCATMPAPEIADVVKMAYDDLTDDSPLRKLFVNEYARTGYALQGPPERWPIGFAMDLYNVVNDAKATEIDIREPAHDCTYHKHTTTQEMMECRNAGKFESWT